MNRAVAWTIFAVIVIAIGLTFCNRAEAHDWYDQFVSDTGVDCCGGFDCRQLTAAEIREETGGFAIQRLPTQDRVVHVPYGAMKPSPDGEYHICVNGTPRGWRCFFGPLPSY